MNDQDYSLHMKFKSYRVFILTNHACPQFDLLLSAWNLTK